MVLEPNTQVVYGSKATPSRSHIHTYTDINEVVHRGESDKTDLKKWKNARTAAEVPYIIPLASAMTHTLFMHLHTLSSHYTFAHLFSQKCPNTHPDTHTPTSPPPLFHFAETIEACPFCVAHCQPRTAHYQCVTPVYAEKGSI